MSVIVEYAPGKMKLKDGSLNSVRVGYVKPINLALVFCNSLQVTRPDFYFQLSPCKNLQGFIVIFYLELLIMITCRLSQKD